MAKGRIIDLSVPDIFRIAGNQALTGAVIFRRDDVCKEVRVRCGHVESVSTSRETESFAAFLLMRGVLTSEQLESASERSGPGHPLPAILVESGFIGSVRITPLVEGWTLEAALELFQWTEGDFEIVLREPDAPPLLFSPIDWRMLVLLGVRRIMSWSRILAGVGDYADVQFQTMPSFQLGFLPLDQNEIATLEMFRFGGTLNQALMSQRVSELAAYRAFWALRLIDALTIKHAAAPVSSVSDPGAGIVSPGRLEPREPVEPEGGWFFPEVLRALHGENRSGCLEVEAAGRKTLLFLVSGDLAGVVPAQGATGEVSVSAARRILLETVLEISRADRGAAWFRRFRDEQTPFTHPVVDTREAVLRCLHDMDNPRQILSLVREGWGGRCLAQNALPGLPGYAPGPAEGFILSLLDGTTTLEQVFQLTQFPESETAAILYKLLVAEFVRFVDSAGKETGHRPSSQPVPPSASAEPKARPEIVGSYAEHAAAIETLSDAEVLGVARGAGDQEIRTAALKKIREFHPDLAPSRSDRLDFEKITRRVLSAREHLLRKSADGESASPSGGRPPGPEPPPSPRPLVPREPADMGRHSYLQGLSFRKKGDLHSAIESFRKAVRFAPDDAEYHFALGQCLAVVRRWHSRAESEFMAAIELDPGAFEYAFALSRLYRDGGGISRAIGVLRKALKLDPENAELSIELSKLEKARRPQPGRGGGKLPGRSSPPG